MRHKDLLMDATKEGLIVKEAPLTFIDGLINGNRNAIRQNIPTLSQKTCVLAEEVIPDEDELNALKAYYNHAPEYQPSISQEDLLKELGIDID